MLGHADAVAVGNLRDGHALLDGGFEVDVIRSDAGCDSKLELRCLRNSFLPSGKPAKTAGK